MRAGIKLLLWLHHFTHGKQADSSKKRLDRNQLITFSIGMEQIAQAAMEDIPQLCDLLAMLFQQEADFTPDRARQERGLRLIIGQPEGGRIFCARVDHRVVGMVSLLFTVSTAEGGRAAWLEDMIVHPDWRGRGLGKRLLQYALAAGKTQGCSRITLLTDGSNRPAMRFYKRAGFERSKMVPFRLKLSWSKTIGG